MTHAVTKMVAIKASMPAAIGLGIQRYSIFDAITPMKVAACNNFSMGCSDAL
jgi:hypothetical protein